MLFAHLKRILCLDGLRLRGPNGARDDKSNSPVWSHHKNLTVAPSAHTACRAEPRHHFGRNPAAEPAFQPYSGGPGFSVIRPGSLSPLYSSPGVNRGLLFVPADCPPVPQRQERAVGTVIPNGADLT